MSWKLVLAAIFKKDKIIGIKVKVVPYTFVCRQVPAREDTYPELSACEVGWPVTFLAAFISQVLTPVTHSLLDDH